jgi:hypothetical protein
VKKAVAAGGKLHRPAAWRRNGEARHCPRRASFRLALLLPGTMAEPHLAAITATSVDVTSRHIAHSPDCRVSDYCCHTQCTRRRRRPNSELALRAKIAMQRSLKSGEPCLFV